MVKLKTAKERLTLNECLDYVEDEMAKLLDEVGNWLGNLEVSNLVYSKKWDKLSEAFDILENVKWFCSVPSSMGHRTIVIVWKRPYGRHLSKKIRMTRVLACLQGMSDFCKEEMSELEAVDDPTEIEEIDDAENPAQAKSQLIEELYDLEGELSHMIDALKKVELTITS